LIVVGGAGKGDAVGFHARDRLVGQNRAAPLVHDAGRRRSDSHRVVDADPRSRGRDVEIIRDLRKLLTVEAIARRVVASMTRDAAKARAADSASRP
jgi:hypothetical protein